jgi:hypothetical protein
MNRRNFLSYLSLLTTTPLLFGSKSQIHTGEVHWSPEDVDEFNNYDPNTLAYWRKIWSIDWRISPNMKHSIITIWGDSVNSLFAFEYAWYETPKANYFDKPKFLNRYEGDRKRMSKYLNYYDVNHKYMLYAENAMNNFIKHCRNINT